MFINYNYTWYICAKTRNALSWEKKFNVQRNAAYGYVCSGDLDLEQVTLAECKDNQT